MIFTALKVVGFTIGALVLIFTALVVGSVFSRKARLRRKITALPVSRIADLSDGMRVRIVGEVAQAGEAMSAPLSKRKVVAWQLKVWRIEPGGAAGSGGSHTEAIDFLLDDGSGAVLVKTAGAALAMAEDHEVTYQFGKAPKIMHKVYTARGNSAPDQARARLDGNEAVVEIGETVAVVGIVSISGHGDDRQISIVADPKHGLLLSDDAV